MSTLGTVADWVKALAPAMVDLADDLAHAGDDIEAIEQARLRHNRRISDEIMARRIGFSRPDTIPAPPETKPEM